MNLPFFKKKSPPSSSREYLYALEINHHLVKSAIWSVINHKPQVLAIGCNASWDDQTNDSLVNACDQTLSDAANHLDVTGHLQPEKVILGLAPDWIGPEKILPEKLAILKFLTGKLSLTPVGFVVTPEAVIRYIQITEGVPPTVILLGVWPQFLEVTLLRLGKFEGIQLVKRSPKIISDVIEGLSRFAHLDMLPSRMLLYDSGGDLEDLKQQLLSHPWQSPQTHLPFLHFPKIELLPADFSIRAICLAGGTEVAQVSSPEPLVPEVLSPQELGFAVDSETPASSPIQSSQPPSPPSPHPKRSFRLPHFHLPHISRPRIPLLLPGLIIGLVLLAIGLGAAYWYLPSATVNLTVLPKSLQHQFDLTADTKISSVDAAGFKIPAQTIDVTVDLQKSIPTTGTKLIGDKATGTVNLVNGTPVPKTFPAGTLLTSSSGLSFTLDADVAVASAAGSADPNSYQPGKASGKATAAAIGSDSNLTAGTEFKVGSYSKLDYVAKNDTAFSGGSSRQVGAVAKADLAKLHDDLTASARDQAKTQLLQKISDSQIVIPESITLQTISDISDHKVDEVADQVGLKLSVKAVALILTHSDLDQLILDQIKSQLPANYAITNNYTQKFSVKSSANTSTILNLQVSASLTPLINQDEVKRTILGKQISPAQDYLKNLPGISKVDILFSPRLPKFLLTLPHVLSHIKVAIIQAD